jgi:Zn finger protein HypA/HybF involved in hydrogenase expression
MKEDDDDIILLRSFNNAFDANIIKSKLEDSGIECFLSNENTSNTLNPIMSNSSNGVRLFIKDIDLEKADNLLTEQDFDPESLAIHCPDCQSAKVEIIEPKEKQKSGKKGFRALLGIIFATSSDIIPSGTGSYKCQDCGHEFEV